MKAPEERKRAHKVRGEKAASTPSPPAAPPNAQDRRAILLSTSRDVGEILELARSLPIKVSAIQIQDREKPDPRSYFGSGKLTEVKREAGLIRADLAIVHDILKPSQLLALQKALGVEVWDRVQLILRIFADRARTPEALLQVERAELQMQIPLVREAISLSKKGENPGFLAGGEVGTATYLNQIRKRTAAIDARLEKIKKESGTRRERRKRSGYFVVSAAGYTNAGKSTLVAAITGADLLIEDRMFSTLSTTTRKVEQLNGVVLMSDTVGFIESLPPFMIDAFNSTISEIYSCDLILLVVDISEDEEAVERKMLVSKQILEASENQPPVLVVLNKRDQVSPEGLAWKVKKLEQRGLLRSDSHVAVSAKTGEGVPELLSRVTERINRLVSAVIELDPGTSAGAREPVVSWLLDNCVASRQTGPFSYQVTCDDSVLKRAETQLKERRVRFEVRRT
jgi:GTP-binding protein HflX